MGKACAVGGCRSQPRSTSVTGKIRFFNVPAIITRECDKTRELSTRRRMLWLARIKRMDLLDIKGDARVCSKHFQGGQPSKLFEDKSIDWAPTLNLEKDVIIPELQDVNVQAVSGGMAPMFEECLVKQEHDALLHYEDEEQPSNIYCNEDLCIDDGDSHLIEDGAAHVLNNFTGEEAAHISSFCATDYLSQNITINKLEDRKLTSEVSCQTEILGHNLADVSSYDRVVEDNAALRSELFETKSTYDRAILDNNALRAEITKLKAELFDAKSFYDRIVLDNSAMRDEMTKLKAKSCDLTEEQFEGDDIKVEFYSGLPSFALFKKVFDFVSVDMDSSHRNSLSKFQSFIMSLMRLRLNFLQHDLAYRFGVSQSTVSNTEDKWLRHMSNKLLKLIVWPEREFLHKNMPQCFKVVFGTKVAVILDSFEIFPEASWTNSQEKKKASQVKHSKSTRYLIGFTPHGTVSFIYRAKVGRASFEEIIEESGILNKLQKGDIVLTERGFNIPEKLGMYRAQVNFSAFTKGWTELSEGETLQDSPEMAGLRCLVDKLFGLVRHRFKILQGYISYKKLLPRGGDTDAPMDHVVQVCCALSNLCPSVIPLRASLLDRSVSAKIVSESMLG